MYLEHPQALEVFEALLEQADDSEKKALASALNAFSDNLKDAFIDFPHHVGFPKDKNLTVEVLRVLILNENDTNEGVLYESSVL